MVAMGCCVVGSPEGRQAVRPPLTPSQTPKPGRHRSSPCGSSLTLFIVFRRPGAQKIMPDRPF